MSLTYNFPIYDSLGSDSLIAFSNVSFETARNKANADTVRYSDGSDPANTMRITVQDSGSDPRFAVCRALLQFNNIQLPSGSGIVSAEIGIYVRTIVNTLGGYIYLVDANPALTDDLTASDFSQISLSATLGSKLISEFSTNEYIYIPLSDLTTLNYLGVTPIGIVASQDYLNTTPSSYGNTIVFDDNSGANPPILRIVYDPPVSADVIEEY